VFARSRDWGRGETAADIASVRRRRYIHEHMFDAFLIVVAHNQ